jgi:hypothetical protein
LLNPLPGCIIPFNGNETRTNPIASMPFFGPMCDYFSQSGCVFIQRHSNCNKPQTKILLGSFLRSYILAA